MWTWLLIAVSGVLVVTSEGRGVRLGLCTDDAVACQCGTPGYLYSAPVEQCTFFYRWKPYCKPCDGKSREEICDRYSHCLECEAKGCRNCPVGRYGETCRGECHCKNGGRCDALTGGCICVPPFEGALCQLNMRNFGMIPSCPEPALPRNSQLTVSHGPQGEFTVGTEVRYACDTGYLMTGDDLITCTARSHWDSPPPVCNKACRLPQGSVHITINILKQSGQPSGRSMGATNSSVGIRRRTRATSDETGLVPTGTQIYFRCSPYYRLVGSVLSTCSSQGSWNKRVPECEPECGLTGAPRTSYIFGGVSAPEGAWPWMAALHVENETEGVYAFKCGATLVGEAWALTAAHCVTDRNTHELVGETQLIILGTNRLDELVDDNHQLQEVVVQAVFVHPHYDPMTLDDDIALLLLNHRVELNERVIPVCLPSTSNQVSPLVAGVNGKVMGWGKTTAAVNSASNELQEATLPVVRKQDCDRAFEDDGFIIGRNMFCAGNGTGDVDVCNGDSGGPFVVAERMAVGTRWFQRGVISWGSPRGCGVEGLYSGFTHIDPYTTWIEETIASVTEDE